MIGRTLGHYRIAEKLGAGGMGDVYRASDTRLGREVALKLLPEAFARDRERLARFEREAKLLAALNHPGIGTIHGLEEADGVRFLVLELVAGGTLEQRLRRGALPIEDALELTRQVAEALEAAHDRGIIHRDLKPGNIQVTPEGKVKVLDFGLGKAAEPVVQSDSDISHSPTLLAGSSQEGVLLGTAAYMSPEQARGRAVDKRTDIWAFGCVLYEALAGKQAFRGETTSDTLAAILKGEPDWAALPAATPGRIRELLRRCLAKDPAHRLHDIADARLEIEEALARPEPGALPPTARASSRWISPAAVLTFVLGVAIGAGLLGTLGPWPARAPTAQGSLRFALPIPAGQLGPTGGQGIGRLGVSPDGTRIAYVGNVGGKVQLFLRRVDSFQTTPLPNTDDATDPFFSPDGQWVGFFTSNKLEKISANGGAPIVLCDASGERGGSWAPDNTIVFAGASSAGLSRVSADGGKPEPLTRLDSQKGENSHRWPQVLPGGKAVLFTIKTTKTSTFNEALIAVESLATHERRIVVHGGSYGRYLPTGHLLFSRAGRLLAVPFDLARLEVTGTPTTALEGVMTDPGNGSAQMGLSESGLLAYLPGGEYGSNQKLVWVGSGGAEQPLPVPPQAYDSVALSPDGRRLAVAIVAANDDIWVIELDRGTLTRLTFESSNNDAPRWSPDGRRILFVSDRLGPYSLFWKPADGSGPDERLLPGQAEQAIGSFSPDGRLLAYGELEPMAQQDIWILPLAGDHKPVPFLRTPFNEMEPAFSPDGRWIAYTSDESGRQEVYVRPYPGPGGKWQVSTGGGSRPQWTRDARQLFYRGDNSIMVVPVTTRPAFSAGQPRLFASGQFHAATSGFGWDYAVAPDGRRVLAIKPSEQQLPPPQINVVVNWFADLRRASH